MSGSKDVTRRVFLEGLGAYSLGGATLSQLSNGRAAVQSGVSYRALNPDPPDASPNAAAWTAPPVLTNPNILIILVD